MNLLQLLTSILKDLPFDLTWVLNLLKENNFNLKSILNNLDLEKVLPIIMDFVNKKDFVKPKSSYLSPISSVADKEIIYTLNKYFSSI